MAKPETLHNADRTKATLALDAPVTSVRMVSPKRAQALGKLGIATVRDLLSNYPRRYVDLSRVTTIAASQIGEACTMRAQVHAVKLKKPRPRLQLTEVTVVDGTGTLIITAFRQPWLADQLKAGMQVAVSGKVEFNYGFKRMTNPYIEVLESSGADFHGMIIPVHPLTGAIKAGLMRSLVRNALQKTEGALDPLPVQLRAKYRLMSRQNALSCIHFPHTMEEQSQARRRLAYEEVLLLELMLMLEGRDRAKGREPVAHVIDGPHVAELAQAVPFELTGEQEQARDDILQKMAEPQAANHLLLGDVGTGKTIVSAFSLAAAADTGGQALFMAPTEILARQHAAGLGPLLEQAGVRCAVLTGSTAPDEREAIIEQLAKREIDVLFGTHALLEPDVACSRCTLVVIDEQQRFGVEQRATLTAKGDCPDVLYLTATPIPRSLAIALFGNLSLSYIKERPRAKAPRKTYLHTLSDRGVAYDAALAACKRGEQVYIVCPLVGEKHPDAGGEGDSREGAPGAAGASSAKGAGSSAAGGRYRGSSSGGLDEEDVYEFDSIAIEDEADMTGANVRAAEDEAAFLQQKVFVDYEVGLVHGKLAAAKKQEVMDRFRSGEISVLVATTVIEVGVDVPNATVMIIEDADRFGLSQLHQLRGRVGRGDLPGEVHLVSGTRKDSALERLGAMLRTEDGFELAAYDLSLRREGDILGNRQHGASLLKLVNVVRDGKLIEAAHADASAILAEDPDLASPQYKALAREARTVFRQQ